jgi:hypothetical protein
MPSLLESLVRVLETELAKKIHGGPVRVEHMCHKMQDLGTFALPDGQP